MISLEVNLDFKKIVTSKSGHESSVKKSLERIEAVVKKKSTNGKVATKTFNEPLYRKFKIQIWKAQNEKCAFCERKIPDKETAHLEHFRPKSEAKDCEGKVVSDHGYWWLAYDDKNFVVACATCNRSKSTYFPLENESLRVTDSSITLESDGGLSGETPLLINPRYDDCDGSFSYETGEGVDVGSLIIMQSIGNKSERGSCSIKFYDLNRVKARRGDAWDRLELNRWLRCKKLISQMALFEFMKEGEAQRETEFGVAQLGADFSSRKDLERQKMLVDRMARNIRESFLAPSGEFAGMCRYWVKMKYNELAAELL